MVKFNRLKRSGALALLLVLLFLTGCQGAATPAPTLAGSPSEGGQTAIAEAGSTETAEPELEDSDSEPTQDNAPAPTAQQPTPAPTLADWRDAPIMPETISPRVHEIYEMGQSQGSDPNSFSVIGDCQSIPFVFMGPFGRGEQVPGAGDGHLWTVLNAFEESFDRWAVTSRGGFTAAAILNSLQADPDECRPGETPLTCEFRLNNPAYVLITLENWRDPDSIDRYEIYLRQIVDSVIEKGAVPILITKADVAELKGERHVLNPAIVNLAYEYQLPVINFWRAAQNLDNNGIDPDREGFHLSDAGYRLKNTLALRALYAVWTELEGREPAAGEEAASAATATPEPAASISPEIITPECPAGCVFFGAALSHDGEIGAHGVYAYQPEAGSLTQILPEGYDLQDVSSNGQRLLVNYENNLFEIDLRSEESTLISETFFDSGRQGAYWDPQGVAVYLDSEDPILTAEGYAYQLFPAPHLEGLYFNSGECNGKHACTSQGVFHRDSSGTITLLETFKTPVFSPDSSRVAFLNPAAANAYNYNRINYILTQQTAVGLASQSRLNLPYASGFMVYPNVESYAFSPDNNRLFLLQNVYSKYFEKSLSLKGYLWNLDNGISYEMGMVEGASGSLNPRFVWAPDGESLLFFLTEQTEDGGYLIRLYETDLATGERFTLLDDAFLTSPDYVYLTNVYWP